jgi:N utilization substance protein B
MGKRREGREAAVQYLFFRDLNSGPNAAGGDAFWNLRPATRGVRDFAQPLIDGVILHQSAIDARIEAATENYQLHRISAVDRNILRLALYEMFHRDDIPPIVSINEAIEIAKKFGTEESGRFVNGILDRVKLDLTRPLRSAGPTRNDRPAA